MRCLVESTGQLCTLQGKQSQHRQRTIEDKWGGEKRGGEGRGGEGRAGQGRAGEGRGGDGVRVGETVEGREVSEERGERGRKGGREGQ